MTKQITQSTDYARSIVNSVKYDDNATTSQQAYVDHAFAAMLNGAMLDDGMSFKSGALLKAASEIRDSFKPDDKALKNNALSKFRMQLRRAVEEMSDGEYTAGHNFQSSKRDEQIVIKAKAKKGKETVDSALAGLVKVYGEDALAEAILRNGAVADAVVTLQIAELERDAA